MRKIILISLLLIVFPIELTLLAVAAHDIPPPGVTGRFVFLHESDSSEFPSMPLLQTALAGYDLLLKEESLQRRDIITIIDFSLPSDQKRLLVLDLIQGKVLFHTLVSHGRNSGELMAERFSNTPGSNISSPGFYATAETYHGKHGLSLNLDGLEEGINDNARTRRIVMHGADYVSDEYINKYGRLGRSFGCPAVPQELSKEIILTIQGGSCLFIHVSKPSYLSNSQIINKITSDLKDSLSPALLPVFDSRPQVQARLFDKRPSGTVSGLYHQTMQ